MAGPVSDPSDHVSFLRFMHRPQLPALRKHQKPGSGSMCLLLNYTWFKEQCKFWQTYESGSANTAHRPNLAYFLYLLIKFYWDRHAHLGMYGLWLLSRCKLQSWVFVTETVCLAKPKIFAIWLRKWFLTLDLNSKVGNLTGKRTFNFILWESKLLLFWTRE